MQVQKTLTTDQLRFEVQMIDDTLESVHKILGFIKDAAEADPQQPLETIRYNFFETFNEFVLDIIGSKDSEEKAYALCMELKDFIANQKNASPAMRYFVVRLHAIKEMLEVYMRADFIIKDLGHLMYADQQARRVAVKSVAILKGLLSLEELKKQFDQPMIDWFLEKRYLIEKEVKKEMRYKVTAKSVAVASHLAGME